MTSATATLRRRVAAPRDVVFDVLTDHEGYASITPLRAVHMEREGERDRDGVGAIRVIRVLGRAGPGVREEVIAYERPGRFEYRVISGLPLRRHEGCVTLVDDADGTQVDYRLDTIPSLPLPRPVVVGIIRVVIGLLLRGVAREAERRAAAEV